MPEPTHPDAAWSCNNCGSDSHDALGCDPAPAHIATGPFYPQGYQAALADAVTAILAEAERLDPANSNDWPDGGFEDAILAGGLRAAAAIVQHIRTGQNEATHV